MFIDTHAHIYSSQFNNYENTLVENFKKAQIDWVLMPAIDSETHENMLQLEMQNSNCTKSMMGVHPCSIQENWEQELAIAKKYLYNGAFVGVGEIGLDFYWDLTFKDQQIAALHQQLEWAVDLKLPVSLHTRNATDEAIAIVEQYIGKGLTGVFHCFGGTVAQANQIINMGFYLGIGGVVTFKKSGLDEVLKHIDLSHIVLETDAPYLAPTPFRGKRNEPGYIPYIVEKISDIYQVSAAEIGKITSTNAKILFKLQ